MFEFILVDNASRLFEEASGCQLHRDPASGKVKFLPLGRWKGTLQQEDLPVRYARLTDQLSMLGVVLTAKYINTRRINAESVKERVSSLIGSWKSGTFMLLSQRPWSLNSYALPLVWYKSGSINLIESDYIKLTSLNKS